MHKKLIAQKLLGILILAIAVLIGGMCAAAGEDAGGFMVLMPLGVWMATTRKKVIL